MKFMFTILLHSSKTMRPGVKTGSDYQKPSLIKEAKELANYIKSLSDNEIGSSMHLSKNLAKKTWYTWQSWDVKENSIPTIDAFLGDIYSGLRSNSFSNEDRLYANERLYIISGLYGILKALDNISPYRLEMAYKLPKEPYSNLYKFWGDKLVSKIHEDTLLLNLTSNEYAKAILPYLGSRKIYSPKFMSLDQAGNPVFVAVHAKIARGAFAGWMIKNRIENTDQLDEFNLLNYHYSEELSTVKQPVFICNSFGGIGLSLRLT